MDEPWDGDDTMQQRPSINTVLHIEDNEVNMRLIERVFERRPTVPATASGSVRWVGARKAGLDPPYKSVCHHIVPKAVAPPAPASTCR